MPWLTPARRRWIYGIATAVLPLLISLGWLDHEAAPLWLAVIGSVLVPGMAAWHTDPSTPTGEPATEYAPPATVDPIVSSEGVHFDNMGAPYDAKHDKES